MSILFSRDLAIESLGYLSSEQALADLAYFIESKNMEYKFDKDVKWIAFGGSYPGSLAAWLREKYPNLVYGSVSTSGPLLAEADFTGKSLLFNISMSFCQNRFFYQFFYRILRSCEGFINNIFTRLCNCCGKINQTSGNLTKTHDRSAKSK